MRRPFQICLLSLLILPCSLKANDTVYVSGGIQHDGLLDWTPVMYHSNSYVDLSVHYRRNDSSAFKGIRASTRLELTQWPLLGYELDFGGHGVSHLSIEAIFDRAELTIGDVYGQFGSGFLLNLYEDRSLGVDNPLRGAKLELNPYKGVHLTMLGGKQKRNWSCYHDQAWGWNYSRDAVLGADAEIDIEQWSQRMQDAQVSLSIGGSYVSKYEQTDTVLTIVDNQYYMYNLPRWVGAGGVRATLGVQDFEFLVEYARKANDPCLENRFSYRDGEALFLSASYSRKGLSLLAQVKRSDNMVFRSDRHRNNIAGRLNNMPVFAYQHTYALPSQNCYATQYAAGEWAFQAEAQYTAPRKSKFGGKYGTTIKAAASHIRGLAKEGSWAIDTRPDGEYYTDVHLELNKRLSKQWWLNAMLMYQNYNQTVVEGKGGFIRSGIAVVDARVQVNNNISMRGELQYLYSPDNEGQWIYALYELSLFHHWTIVGNWMHNIGFGPNSTYRHFYTAALTYTHSAHRASIGYTKTMEGMQCSGGICRFVPAQEGVTVNYSFTF